MRTFFDLGLHSSDSTWTWLSVFSAYADLKNLTVKLVRGPGSYGNVSAEITTSDITAQQGLDYFTATQPISIWFPDSVRSGAVTVRLADDGLVHPAKQFTLQLTGTTGHSSDVKRGQNLEAEARTMRSTPRPRPKIIMKKVPNND